ncbi:MAG: hypothetical protein KGL39_31460 [Patescibacteria group bacterium]|nr:hypothetical protein [Patescibacteria group bacterium]
MRLPHFSSEFAIRLQAFTGMTPRMDYRLLPDNGASFASNMYLTSGRIDPMRIPQDINATLSSTGAKSIYRMFSGTNDYWLSWDSDVDVVREPVLGDQEFHICFTSDQFEPRKTDLSMATGSAEPYPNSWYVLGVFPPTAAPTVTSSGGSGTQETRAYTYTFVTQDGEESAPAPASALLTGYITDTWAISGMQVAPSNNGTITAAASTGGVTTVTLDSVFGIRAYETLTFSGVGGMTDLNGTFRLTGVNTTTNQVTIALTTTQTYTSGGAWVRVAPHNTVNMTKRVYRTATASDGTSTYYFVAEIPVTDTTYSDTILGVDLGEPIPTTGWDMPPANMWGIVSLPNGILAGFFSNVICFSDPYHPYAWPLAYQLTSDFPVVALGVFGQTVVVGTQGIPYTATGTDPSTMTLSKMPYPWPCLSKRGMTSFGGSVVYPTTLGLASIGAAGESILTSGLYSQVDWMALNPATFIADNFNSAYYAYHNGVAQEVLIISADFGVVVLNMVPSEIWSDPANGNIYVQNGGYIQDLNPTTGANQIATWASKEMVYPSPLNLGCGKIDAEFELNAADLAAVNAYNATVTAYNANLIATMGPMGLYGALNTKPVNSTAVNGDDLRTDFAPGSGQIGITVVANDIPLYSITVNNENMFRLPAGVKYDNAWIQINTNVPIQSIVLAETAKGLRAV